MKTYLEKREDGKFTIHMDARVNEMHLSIVKGVEGVEWATNAIASQYGIAFQVAKVFDPITVANEVRDALTEQG